MIVILWKRLNWLPTFIYVVKLDNERQRAELKEKKKLWEISRFLGEFMHGVSAA